MTHLFNKLFLNVLIGGIIVRNRYVKIRCCVLLSFACSVLLALLVSLLLTALLLCSCFVLLFFVFVCFRRLAVNSLLFGLHVWFARVACMHWMFYLLSVLSLSVSLVLLHFHIS